MKIKHRLFYSLLFLFAVIILIGGVGSYYLRLLANDSALIMKDNYRTLSYLKNIEEALNYIEANTLQNNTRKEAIAEQFEIISEFLSLQQTNITEPGEKELTRKLARSLNSLQTSYQESEEIQVDYYVQQVLPIIREIQEISSSIYLINEQTMLQKNQQAGETAREVVLYMTIIGVSSVLIGLFFIIWLPFSISRPISQFSRGISEVARGNYQINIAIDRKDEFGELASSFNKMAAKLNEYEHSSLAKLLKEQKRLNAVINQMNEVILGLDESKNIIFINNICLELLGLNREDVMGIHATEVAESNQLFHSLIGDLMVGANYKKNKPAKPLKIIQNNIEKLYAKNIIDVLETPTGENRKILIGHVVILTDITEYSEQDKAKTHFISTLSHELKTPVSAISMSLNLLKNNKTGPLTQPQAELLETLEENNARISHMINEVLSISRIESGRIDVNLNKEDAESIIEKAIDGVQIFLNEKKLNVNQQYCCKYNFINADAHKTVWILNNFLTNAIRYSPIGGTITIKTEIVDTIYKISVTDQGPGITREAQDKIFQKFTRLDLSHHGGTGLGLAISKEFIEAMGGSIGLKSKPGAGTTFWICLLTK